MLKKALTLLLVTLLCLSVFAGCAGDEPAATTEPQAPAAGTSEPTANVPEMTQEPTQAQTQDTQPQQTEPRGTSEATDATEAPTVQFRMDRDSVTLVSHGEEFTLYTGAIDPALITWGTRDSSVATIDKGVVKAVSKGSTVVYGEYQGSYSECQVNCNLQDTPTTPPETEPQQPTTGGSRDPVKALPTTQVVDSSFFNDAAFVGDSISLMLSNYAEKSGELGSATFLVRGSYGVGNEVVANYHIIYQGVETLLEDAISDCGAKKVFIMLGMNDIGLYGIDGTIENWGLLIQRLRAKCPEVEIYIQSMTPVWTGGEKGGLRNPNVDAYNVKLQAFAQANGCKYIDVASYMKDSTGGLATIYCSDSYVHLSEEGAKAWIKILKAYTGY